MILPKGISSSASAAPPPTPPALAATGTSTPAATIPPTFLKDRRNRALEHWLADGMAGGSKKTAEQEMDEAQGVVKELTMALARMDDRGAPLAARSRFHAPRAEPGTEIGRGHQQ